MFRPISETIFYIFPWCPSEIHSGKIVDYYRLDYVLEPREVVPREYCSPTYRDALCKQKRMLSRETA